MEILLSHAYLRSTIEYDIKLCKRSDAYESAKPKAERRETSLNLQHPRHRGLQFA